MRWRACPDGLPPPHAHKNGTVENAQPYRDFVYFRYIAFSGVGITIEELPRVPFLAAFNCMTGQRAARLTECWRFYPVRARSTAMVQQFHRPKRIGQTGA